MSLPPAFLDELRTRLPLSAYAGKRMRLVRVGREFKACCPFHTEKTPSFYINDAKGFFHCFGCGVHGDVINLAMRLGSLSFPEAVNQLAGEAGLQVPRFEAQPQAVLDHTKTLYELLDWTANWFARALETSDGQVARDYLKRRGLSADAIRAFRLGYAPADAGKLRQAIEQAGFKSADAVEVGILKQSEDGREPYSFFRNRLIFPVADVKARVVAFGARLMDGDGPKYINSPDHPLFHKGQMLYNLGNAREALAQHNQPFIVVEGYMDVIALAESGFGGAVAPLGTALTEAQVELLWRLQQSRPELVETSPLLCFDGDEAGRRAATRGMQRILPLVSPKRTARIAYMPQGDDPDSLIRKNGPQAFATVLAQSKSLFAALWEQRIQNRMLESPEARARLKSDMEELFADIADPTVKALYRDELRQKLYALGRSVMSPSAGTYSGARRQPWQSRIQSVPQQNRSWPVNGGKRTGWGSAGGAQSGPWRPQGDAQIALPPIRSSASLKERTLLALLVNHPMLYPEVAEAFERYPFTDMALEALRLELIAYFEQHPHIQSLDAEAIASYLSGKSGGESGLLQSLRFVLSDETYLHAGFAKPDRPLAEARLGWQNIWDMLVQDDMMAEKRAQGLALRETLADGEDEASYERLLALHQETEASSDPFRNEDNS